jgi:formamidopyrimidine-DNA glycosylase
LGPEINNSSEFNVDYLTNVVNTKKGMTKVIILDQETICGAGNIYADEILFRAKVHPEKDISKLTK